MPGNKEATMSRILIIDDEATLRRVLRSILERASPVSQVDEVSVACDKHLGLAIPPSTLFIFL